MTLSDLWLFAISVLGLWLVPPALGRLAGGFVVAFGVMGLFLIAQPELPILMQPAHSPALWFLLTLVPLALIIPDLFARGRIARVVDEVPLRDLMGWSVIHVLGLRHIFSAMQGDLEVGYALSLVSGEFFSAFGAVVLWIWNRPSSRWFLVLALFWNIHALVTTLEFSVRLMTAHPGIPFFSNPSPGHFSFFSSWPGALESLFWAPFLLCLHATLFYKMLRVTPLRPVDETRGFTPGSPL
jgi:hypothetical protein